MKILEDIDELLTYLEDTAHGEEGKRITEMRNRIHTELSNSHKPVIMQGPPTDDEIERWVKGHGYYGHCTQEYHEGLEEGARWGITKMSSGTAVADGAVGQNGSVGCLHKRWYEFDDCVVCLDCGLKKD
jgi:hypothetical protein